MRAVCTASPVETPSIAARASFKSICSRGARPPLLSRTSVASGFSAIVRVSFAAAASTAPGGPESA